MTESQGFFTEKTPAAVEMVCRIHVGVMGVYIGCRLFYSI